MESIQHFSSLCVIHRGDHRIVGCLDHTICEADEEGRKEKGIKAIGKVSKM